jgi:hypothetical protein
LRTSGRQRGAEGFVISSSVVGWLRFSSGVTHTIFVLGMA